MRSLIITLVLFWGTAVFRQPHIERTSSHFIPQSYPRRQSGHFPTRDMYDQPDPLPGKILWYNMTFRQSQGGW